MGAIGMKVEHTMTPEEIAQWEKDVGLVAYWPGGLEERRAAMRALARMFQPIPKNRRHGTYSCYVTGCRCPKCCEASNAYHRTWYAARKPGADREAIMRRWRQAEMGAKK